MLSDYDALFQEVCAELELPWVKVLTFAKILTGLSPEFRENDVYGPRAGLMAMPEREAVHFGILPLDLVVPAHSIRAGCEALREYYDEFWELGNSAERMTAAFNYYLRDWPVRQETWKKAFDNRYHHNNSTVKSAAVEEL
ncbi:MAG TPA: hypothetical protein P5110_09850 [Candidatus Omnitrophota bacterium]|nr:hypothetical protein [Candidatus Omnitrophota bacterium]